jgi:hypothetical protein
VRKWGIELLQEAESMNLHNPRSNAQRVQPAVEHLCDIIGCKIFQSAWVLPRNLAFECREHLFVQTEHNKTKFKTC